MLYSYIWIEGQRQLNDFCQRRFGQQPDFCETIGRCADATIYEIYKFDAQRNRYVDCYFLFMQHTSGKLFWSDIQQAMRQSYEEIRTNRTSIVKR